jgi:hypothetical protein
MSLRRTRAENLAVTMLARDGIAAIWVLRLRVGRTRSCQLVVASPSALRLARRPAIGDRGD